MEPSSRFWDFIAKRYARTPVPDEAVYQRKLAITREYLQPDSHVVELGCGTGSTAIAHAPHVQCVEAVDISEKMLAIARGKAAADGIENVSFARGSVESFSAATRPDAVLCLSLLHLLGDRRAALAKIHEFMRPGGYLISSTACIADDMAFMRWLLPIGHWLRLVPLVKVFSRDELVDGMRDAGFDIVREWRPGKGKAVFIVAQKADS